MINVACPANCVTGGTEALHSFVHELSKLTEARLYYFDIKESDPCPKEYKGYQCDYVTELNNPDVLIVPEIWADRIIDYQVKVKCIYWLGIDAYASWNKDQGRFLQDPDIIHICQSDYAMDFLGKLGLKAIKCTDTVNKDFYQVYSGERSDEILYNPAKATPFTYEVLEGYKTKPIRGMTRDEVIDAMHHAKLYVDFGEFPGRERMPREAALCGCCLITSKIGSADYYGDFAHDYKYDSKSSHLWAIRHKVNQVLEHYDKCTKDFDVFRDDLRQDIMRIPQQVREVVHEILNHYPGA